MDHLFFQGSQVSVFESDSPHYENVWTTPVLRNGYPKTISEEFSCSNNAEDVVVPEAYQSNINAAVSNLQKEASG